MSGGNTAALAWHKLHSAARARAMLISSGRWDDVTAQAQARALYSERVRELLACVHQHYPELPAPAVVPTRGALHPLDGAACEGWAAQVLAEQYGVTRAVERGEHHGRE